MSKPTIPLGFGGLFASAGDHIAHFYTSRDEWQELLVAYLCTGISGGEKCVYIARSGPGSKLARRALEGSNGEIQEALSIGQLTLLDGDKPRSMQAKLADALKDVPQRYPRLRWVGDMTWSLNCCTTPELMTWESHCNGYPEVPVVFLCQYDLTSFPGDVVMDAMKTHPLCIVGNTIHKNPYYVEPAVFLDELRAATGEEQTSKDGDTVELNK